MCLLPVEMLNRSRLYFYSHKNTPRGVGYYLLGRVLKISSIVYALVSTGLMFVDIDCYAGNNYNYNIHL